jgi:hypothetical protein
VCVSLDVAGEAAKHLADRIAVVLGTRGRLGRLDVANARGVDQKRRKRLIFIHNPRE